jgi:hypothetical protein
MKGKLDDNKQIVMDLVNHIGDQEKHFNGLETQYRLLTSTWLLASLGAIGFLLQADKQVLFGKFLLIGLIGSIGCIGIFLLWLLDIKVYHKLLHCVFLQGINLEQQYDWLPKIRTDMLLNIETGDVTRSTGLYYTGSCVLLLLISIIAFINCVCSIALIGIIILVGLALIFLLVYYMQHSAISKRAMKLSEKLKEAYVDDLI